MTCSAVFSRFSISKEFVLDVCFGTSEDGAGELSGSSGEYNSLPKTIVILRLSNLEWLEGMRKTCDTHSKRVPVQ